ncbi:MAG TPA: cache domain-containing protein, partial [Bacillota bacterium]|nr:cache domain-containing protein [Bacillota bacterium]
MKKSRSFKKELIYSFLTIVLVVIALLGLFQIFQLSSLVKENQKTQEQTTKFLEDYVVNYVEEHQRAIEAKVSSIKDVYESGNTQAIEEELKDVVDNYPGFVNLYVGNRAGKSIAFYPKVFQDNKERENIDFSDRDYYKYLVNEKETVISESFPGRGGTDQQLVTIATPLLNEKDEFEGYLLGAIDLTVLGEHIDNRNFGKEGYAVILDQKNNVIVHPTMRPGEEFTNSSDADIVEYIKEHDDRGGQYFKSDERGKEYITYETVDGLGWTIWVGKPSSVITNTYKKAIITIIGFIIITVLVMIGVSFILTNRLEKTIQQLLNYIKDYTKNFRIKDVFREKFHGPKEMEQLSVHFDQMIDEIETNRKELMELNTDLEERVQLRTKDLEHKNFELRAVNKLITSVSSDTDLAHFIQECLQKIAPYMDYSVHVLFQGSAITHSDILFGQELEDYKKQQ